MSEGLNLQTSGRLINYDMPWNLMRVEQRIGRVDRIGASYKDIRISNYFYADTVEEQVYKGIAEDYGDFTDIVGDAAPVLANIEKAIERLALTGHATTTEIDSKSDRFASRSRTSRVSLSATTTWADPAMAVGSSSRQRWRAVHLCETWNVYSRRTA